MGSKFFMNFLLFFEFSGPRILAGSDRVPGPTSNLSLNFGIRVFWVGESDFEIRFDDFPTP